MGDSVNSGDCSESKGSPQNAFSEKVGHLAQQGAKAQMFNQFFYFAMKKSKELIKSLETLKNQVYSLSRAAKMQRCEYLISEIGLTIEFIKDLEFYCAL